MTKGRMSRRDTLAAAAGFGAVMAMGDLAQAKAAEAGKMKFRGVVYDVGLRFAPGPLSVEPFNPALVKHDLHVIAKDLHSTAVRIEGEEIDRLVTASKIAHAEGLTVFFNPWKMNAPVAELPAYFAEAARAAEKLRKDGVDIVFVAGCEMSLFNAGLFPGETLTDRITWLVGQMQTAKPGTTPQGFADTWPHLNKILAEAVKAIRAEFHGRVTYAALAFEKVEWSLFDIVGVDYYRQGETDEAYVAGIDNHRVPGKPFVVMEVGCCAYEGAAALGAGGFTVIQGINPDGSGKWANGKVPVRSEKEQADYVSGVLELLDRGGADGVFIYVFSFPTYPTGEGAKDLDMAAFGLVKTFPASDPRSKAMPPWAPKEAFHRVAEFNRRYAALAGAKR